MTKYYVRTSEYGEFWFRNDRRNRVFGPAITYPSNGQPGKSEWWYKDDKFHRKGGPAVTEPDGEVFYYLNGVLYTKEEYDEVLREDYSIQ